MPDLKPLAQRVHAANKKWWVDIKTEEPLKRDIPEMLALVQSEITEALEAYRKDLMDSKLPQYHGIDVELVDAVIRLLDMIGGLALDEAQGDKLIKRNFNMEGTLFSNRVFFINRVINVIYQRPVSADFNYFNKDCFNISNAVWAIEYIWAVQREYGKHPGEFWQIFEAKMNFNANREDHTLEHRRGKHGKKI